MEATYIPPMYLVMKPNKCMFCDGDKNISMKSINMYDLNTGWIYCDDCVHHLEYSVEVEKDFAKSIGLGLFGITTDTLVKIPRTSGEETIGHVGSNFFITNTDEITETKWIGVFTTWDFRGIAYNKVTHLEKFIAVNNLDCSNLNKQQFIKSYKHLLIMRKVCKEDELEKLEQLSGDFWALISKATKKEK